MVVDLYNKDGLVSGQIELNEDVFGIAPNENAMHQVIVAYLNNQRQGTAKTKTRDEVSGGGKKPWKQKGRGTARAGSTRSPLWSGGGTIHGPKPGVSAYKINKKLNKLSRKSAFSLRLSENTMKFLQDFTMEDAKTKEFVKILSNLNVNGQSTLIITPNDDNNLWLSSRNLKKTKVSSFDKISTYDILNHKNIMIMESAVKPIEENLI